MLIDEIAEAIATGLAQEYEGFGEFCAKYLRHHFSKPGSIFHGDLILRLAQILKKRNQKDVWIAPRGNAKSTIISMAYILYCICTGQERYIVLVGDTRENAKAFLETVKDELEGNQKLIRAYPGATGKGPTWSTETIITANNIKVDAMGMRGKIRGRRFGAWRPTLIIVDDPENDESVISARQRERTLNWLMKGAVSAGVPRHTNIVVIGTVINAECLVQTLAEGDTVSGWNARVYKSITEWPTAMDLWEEWSEIFWDERDDEDKPKSHAFYEANKEAMHEGAKVLWPEHESLYDLMVLRNEIGKLAFESEKQNAAVNPDTCKFGDEWCNVKNFWWDEIPLEEGGWRCIGACDPSLGEKRGDYAALVSIWFKPGHRWLYVDCELKRLASGPLINRILELHQANRYEAYAFETNGFQTVLKDILATASGEKSMWLPVVCVNHKKKKEVRIERLSPYLDASYFRFRRKRKGVNLLIRQMKMYPIADHDDGPDALEMCLNVVERAAA